MEKRHYYYEGMFLLSQAVAADLGGAVGHIREILARGNAEIVAIRKWDDRRLAYEIKGNKRGVYILVYFKAPNDQVAHIERDCNLSEKILRFMFPRCDHLTLEEMTAADDAKGLEAEIRLRGSRPEGDAAQPVPAAEAETAGTEA